MKDWMKEWGLGVSDAIRRLRNDLGITQEQLARRMGCTTRNVAKWESGKLESLPPDVVMQLRHVAIQAEDEDLAAYFTELFGQTGWDPNSVVVNAYQFLPGNLLEMQVVGELLLRLRNNDPAIDPILSQIHALSDQRRVEEEKEIERQRAARPKRSGSLRDRILAMRAEKQKAHSKKKE
jgi:transcriptional regulator with XRE-family HTH domain